MNKEESHAFLRSAQEKLELLKQKLAAIGSAVLAFSGGVDSTFLLWVAREKLGANLLAVIACSESYPVKELEHAKALADSAGVAYLVIRTDEMDCPDYVSNPPERCYYCKSELFDRLTAIAHERGLAHVLDGSNADDSSDFRPGARAARERHVRSPLAEAGLSKVEIRFLSREMGLETWNKPSMACLSSRIPYGERITREKLRQVEEAERFLVEAGLEVVRVRHHGDVARIEVTLEDLPKLTAGDLRSKTVDFLKSLGFTYVTVDLLGYRSGSMNEAVNRSSSDSSRS